MSLNVLDMFPKRMTDLSVGRRNCEGEGARYSL